MGSWGHEVGESDTFADVYDQFFGHYNNGAAPEDASATVRSELNDAFDDYDDQYDAHFALAFAQWETQSLEQSLLNKVAEIIESGADLKNWEERGADFPTLEKRAASLSLFLKTLRSPRPSKKRRKRPKKSDFHMEVLAEIPAPDGKKVFSVVEEFWDGAYIHTSADLMWGMEGGSVFFFAKQGAKVAARWVDSQNLEVSIEPGIEFSKKDDRAFFCGDEVFVRYREV